ncbi:FliH/SctL family protein [Sphingomonas floccifaciens]|uniref:FliH/SctL family protein n=1 Tax=Sphingomonas floccifaciens TaxID=1844115 RepID=A0ABW4NBC7_9SPHN
MTDFQAGFVSRHDAAAAALSAAFAVPGGFEPRDLAGTHSRGRPRSFSPQGEGGPRHFTPFDPDNRSTDGWDMLNPDDTNGFSDPVAAARDAAHAEGFAAGLAHAAAEAGRDRALADALGAALGAGVAFDRDRLALQLRQTVLLLVSRVVGDVGVSADLLTQRIETAVEALADSAESALLRLNPSDVGLVEGRLPATLFAVGDPHVTRGSFVLESASTIVEDGPDRWLEQLTAAIDKVATPSC